MRWLASYFARALVRRTVYLLVAIVFAYFGFGNAHAQQSLNCSADYTEQTSNGCADEGEAYAMAYAAYGKWASTISGSTAACAPVYSYSGSQKFSLKFTASFNGGSCTALTLYRGFVSGATCSQRNTNKIADAAQSYSSSGVSTCIAGCQVQGTSFSTQTGGVNIYGMRDRTYNGQICNASKPSNDISQVQSDKVDANKPKAPECMALESGQTACIKTNGDYCATASTGKTFCWAPQETGKKADGTEAQVKSPKGEPVTPPSTTISDQEWQRKEGHQQTACVNSTCITYNVTNYSSVPSGTAKNSTGDNTSTGSGNTSGNGAPGKGTKDGDDDGDGDSASDSGNCTVPPACVGDTLKCLHLKFTWKTQCNTLRSEITKGDGCADGDVPVCAGDSCKAADYASVLQQWKQRCAAQALGEGMATRAAGISNADDAGVVAGIWGGESGGSGLTLRQDLVQVGGGGSLLPDVEIEGSHWTVPQGFYDAIAAVRMVIIAMCTVIAMFVVGRNI
ncbi:A coat protein [Xanthomonas translucens pv. translucens]|nr:A coat protein [Xanthomonas translucens]MCC8444854.1 A coat protein [Xanthomonas translucens pv. translucens]UNU00009.1 A coat protein [Xanthomonas translucens pv. translucens]